VLEGSEFMTAACPPIPSNTLCREKLAEPLVIDFSTETSVSRSSWGSDVQWYFGTISRAQAETTLRNHLSEDGVFLIRKSA
jgi:hypothetical protein